MLVLRLIRRCAAWLPFLMCACFCSRVRRLAVFTPKAALPLALLFPGLLIRCPKSYVLAKSSVGRELRPIVAYH